jgi:hypothetical protein
LLCGAGEVLPAFVSSGGKNPYRYTQLAILHYHFSCYETFIKVTQTALLSHRYMRVNESKLEQLARLTPLAEGFPQTCKVPSCHKVVDYIAHLQSPAAHREKYIADHTKSGTSIHFPQMSQLLKQLYQQYEGN